MSAPAQTNARHLHLVRAAQSAGEAFACPVQDDRSAQGSPAVQRLLWLAAGLILIAALITAL